MDVFRAQRCADGALFDDSIGAASEPARSSREMSCASARLMLPEMMVLPLGMGSLMEGAVTTSALPCSTSTIAMPFADVVAGEVGEDFRADVVS